MKNENHIKIPWYRRNIVPRQAGNVGIRPINIRFPQTRMTPIRQPQPQPATQPETQPATQPATDPVRVPVSDPIPGLPGLPRREEEGEGKQPFPFPLPQREPVLSFLGPKYDSLEYASRLPTADIKPVQPKLAPAPEKKQPILQNVEKIATGLLVVALGKKHLDNWVKANITDPVYAAMLKDPVLGLALREAEKANLDMEAVANYFANYDWDNFELEEFRTGLTAIVGAAAAARIVVFFIGRKVLFRI
jgi:hypothetical protein